MEQAALRRPGRAAAGAHPAWRASRAAAHTSRPAPSASNAVRVAGQWQAGGWRVPEGQAAERALVRTCDGTVTKRGGRRLSPGAARRLTPNKQTATHLPNRQQRPAVPPRSRRPRRRGTREPQQQPRPPTPPGQPCPACNQGRMVIVEGPGPLGLLNGCTAPPPCGPALPWPARLPAPQWHRHQP